MLGINKVISVFKKQQEIIGEYISTDRYKIDWLISYYKANGYEINEFNLIGIRDYTGIDKDVINDYIGYWNENEINLYPATTDPSVHYTKDKKDRHPQGTFHLMEGFHEKIWIIGSHKGYQAFQNHWEYCRPTRGWRDSNYNFIRDPRELEYIGHFAINLHRMHPNILALFIGRYSAGCQVIRSADHFKDLLTKAKKTKMYLNNSNKTLFNYLLINIEDLPNNFV